MKHAQVINLNDDSVLAFNNSDVIHNTSQIPLYQLEVSVLQVDVQLWDLMSNSAVTIEDVTLTHQSSPGFWMLDLDDIKDDLDDRHKYVGKIVPNVSETEELREFKILEFAVDNDSFEGVLARLMYQIVIDGGEAYFVWHTESQALYYAAAYEGGTGFTFASDPSRVTHRGPLQVGTPPITPPSYS